MDFSDEHYVRAYTRDTKTWKKLPWQGRVVLLFVLRKLDKAGVLDDIDELIEDVALVTELPIDLVDVGLPPLLASGTFEFRGNRLVMPNYIEAQTATKSDAARARDSRQRRRLQALEESRNVTGGHETNEHVTVCDGTEHEVPGQGSITNRDVDVTKRDIGSRNEAECSTADQPRHSTQNNAEQRGAEEEAPAPSQTQSIQDRCRWLLKNSWDATQLEPNRWPELVAVVDAFNAATGRDEKLGTFSPNPSTGSTRVLVENFAAGHSVDELVWAAKSWTRSEHYRAAMAQPGRKPSLSWLKGDVLVTELAKRNPGKASHVDPETEARIAKASAARARVEAQTNAEIARMNREAAARPVDPDLVKNFLGTFGR